MGKIVKNPELAEELKKIFYQLYIIDWEKRISPEEKLESVKDYINGFEELSEIIEYTYKDYLNDFGYNGELYVCYEEFLDSEFRDQEYIKSLLRNEDVAISDYLIAIYQDLLDD